MNETEIKIRTFLNKYVRSNYENEDNLFEAGLVNSLFAMQLIYFLEKTYDIKVENNELDINNFKSVYAICDFVERKLAAEGKMG